MTNNGDGWYSYTFTNIASATVIFNDGSSQSADLPRSTTGWYLDGVWYDTKPAVPAVNASSGNPAVKVSSSTAEYQAAPAPDLLASTTIYPNPVTERTFNVYVAGLKNNELATVTILDINGKQVLNTRISQSGKITHNLGTGVYFVRITSSGLNITKKLVIE